MMGDYLPLFSVFKIYIHIYVCVCVCVCVIYFVLIIGFPRSTGVWTQGLMVARKEFYHLSHVVALFCFSYFSGRVLHFCLGLASDCDPPTYGLPCSWNHKPAPPHPAYWLRWRSFANLFCPVWPQTMILLSSWDYKWVPTPGLNYGFNYTSFHILVALNLFD
jgi:hypothetical protein